MAERRARAAAASRDAAGRSARLARPSLSDAFVDAVAADFIAHGSAAIVKIREEKPDLYLKVVIGLLPKELADEACGTAELRIGADRVSSILAARADLFAIAAARQPGPMPAGTSDADAAQQR